MARIGEGDPRWIVQAREDGTNVNAWHWTEKDCTAWSRRRLSQQFDGAQLVESPSIVCTGLDSLGGEAFLNNRKARLVASYELNVSLGWRGTAANGEEAAGTIELPYLADENEDEEPEVKVAVAEETPAAAELRTALLRQGGREAVRRIILQFIQELKAGAPLKEKGAAAAENGQAAAAAGAGGGAADSSAAASSGVAASSKAAANGSSKSSGSSSKASSRTTLELQREFYCRPSDLIECFLVEGRVRAFTQSPATVDPRPGGSFSWFGGSVTGTFLELDTPRRVVMEWRFSSWSDGVSSRVEVQLDEPEPGSTTLRLSQTGIPEEDRFGNHDVKLQVEQGWDGQIFSRIKKVFGFGA